MGLKDLTPEQLQQAKDFILVLEFYGVKEEDIKEIKNIPAMKQKIASLEEEVDRLKVALNAKEKGKDDVKLGEAIKEHFDYGEGGDF